MANVIISQFRGIQRETGFPAQAAETLIASEAVEIAGASAQSDAMDDATTLIRVYAEADCNIALGEDPDASADAVIPLAAGQFDYFGVQKGASLKVAVIERTVA